MQFDTPIDHTDDRYAGPEREPRQLLQDQEYGGQKSIHDGDMADKLGLAGAPIEGPTHFSQIDPLAVAAFGPQWFERGCISSHFRTMVFEGERVRAQLTKTGDATATIAAEKADGTPVLVGTATVDPAAPTALRERLAQMQQRDPGRLYIVDTLTVGETSIEDETHAVDFDTNNGKLYPFSLREKLDTITERHPWYDSDDNPWGRPILPFEMFSVLANKQGRPSRVRGPSTGLFIDLEVRAEGTPLFVGEPYRVERTVLAVGQSRRVESYWTESKLFDGKGTHAATVLLHQGVFKASYAGYPDEH